MTDLERRLCEIEARVKAGAPEDCWAGFLVENFAPADIDLLRSAPTDLARLCAALRLAIQQRTNSMGDFTLDRYEKILAMREKYDAAIAEVLKGGGA